MWWILNVHSENENCFAGRKTKPADGLGLGRGRSVGLVVRLTGCLCINRPKMKQARTVCIQRNTASLFIPQYSHNVSRPSSTSPLCSHIHQLALLPIGAHRSRDGLRDALQQYVLRSSPAHEVRLSSSELPIQEQRWQLDLLLMPAGSQHPGLVHDAPEQTDHEPRVLFSRECRDHVRSRVLQQVHTIW